MTINSYKDIPKFPILNYSVDVPWSMLENWVSEHSELHLQLNPDFQRGHVWTEAQQIAYIEFMLKCPDSGRDIYCNHPGWLNSWKGDFVLVDGLQRLTAIRRFMNNEIPAYGKLQKELGAKPPFDYRVRIHISKLKTRAEVLQWYLDFNSAGTIHSKEELSRVKGLIENELKS